MFGKSSMSSTTKKSATTAAVGHGQDDALMRGLYEVLITSIAVVILFYLPSFVSLFEGDMPSWKTSETSRMRHAAWPLLKDPDSLIVIQLIIRCTLLARICWSGVAGIRAACGNSARARTLSSAATVLFVAAYLSRMMLFQFIAFRLDGPIGGLSAMTVDAVSVCLLTTILVAVLSSGRMAEALGAFLLAPCVLAVCFWYASKNYLEVDPEAGPLWNAAFMLSELLDAAACVALLCGPCLSSLRLPSFVLGPVVVFQQALGLYYFLDSLELAPQSTLSFAAGFAVGNDEVIIEALPMQGKPEELLIATQCIQLGVAVLGMLVVSLRSSPAFAHAVSNAAPLLEITDAEGTTAKEKQFYAKTFDV